MEISIGTPYALNEIGNRPHQEDCIMPQSAANAIGGKCFVLCDGMGGYVHGDLAGQLVATAFYRTVDEEQNVGKDPDTIIADGIRKAFDALDAYAVDGDYQNMGTTLAALYIAADEYYAVHIGDSRIYHMRPSLYSPENPKQCVVYKSWDHSLVNLLVKIGEISEEEAQTHPKRNVLTKAMQPNRDDARSIADIHHSADVLPGDYFFLASDGVTGSIKDETLCSIFANREMADTEKIALINRLCVENSNDNYSCWLIPVS